MTAEGGIVARSLLNRIPAAERLNAVQEAVEALSVHTGPAEAALTVSLLSAQPDDAIRRDLLSRLLEAVEQYALVTVQAACERDPSLRQQLLGLVADRLVNEARRLTLDPGDDVRVRLSDIVPVDNRAAGDLDQHEAAPVAVKPLLDFARLSTSSHRDAQSLNSLFDATLIFLGASDHDVSRSARDVLFTLPPYLTDTALPDQSLIWKCVQRLLTAPVVTFYQDLGYSIWLRQCADMSDSLKIWFEPSYWVLLRQGLRNGDAERRKQCLAILRQSISVGMTDETTRLTICRQRNDGDSTGTELIEDQYERYCTVFETILLGRYLNQVIECEGDLSMLASPASLIPSVWLYTLLAPALGSKMQDSNRKFIGNWIMRTRFQPDTTDDFTVFFRAAFLPWATQGQLFTATLRKRDGKLRCTHGEQLASYVTHLLVTNAAHAGACQRIVESVLELLIGRRSGSFAYANVYLLEGLAKAFETTSDLVLDTAQLDSIVKLSSWTELPEVARDYVLVCCLKLCAESTLRSNEALGNASVLEATRQWHGLQKRCSQQEPHESLQNQDPISSWESEMSNRDIMEQLTIEKMQGLCQTLSSLAANQIESRLQDLWGDIEYLEYPKRLLISMPSVVLQPGLMESAASAEGLQSTVMDMLQKLQDLSRNRLYMLSPLVCALRSVILDVPRTIKLLESQNFILHYAESLPQATVDLQLESATTHLLQSVSPELERFDYEYYFGDRESVGIAALLDLVSRLGAIELGATKSVFDHVLQRWVKQKSPPPTVSPWKSALQLQIMLLCSEQLTPTAEPSALLRLLDDLHYILSIEPLPRYRYLLTWMIARIYLLREDLRPRILDELATKDHHSNPKYLASLMKLGVMLAKVESSGQDFALKLASAFIPLAASSKVVIRHEAQWQVPILMDHAKSMQWTAISESPALLALDDYIRSLERFDDPPFERQIDRFDPIKDHTTTNLVEGPWWKLDDIESPLCGRADFVKLLDRDAASDLAQSTTNPSCIPLGEPIPSQHTSDPAAGTNQYPSQPTPNPSLAPSAAGGTRALQTKGTAYLSTTTTHSSQTSPRSPLIVIASLVDNPHNLGGLSRVAEIFGAAELHLQNQNVVGTKDFTAVAVSSHLHFPIHQLSAAAVPAYLAEKKKMRDEGWKVVGVEQTDRSVLLGSEECRLPEKCVLVLGSEKEGIPALVLAECDLLVEIPQVGVTRSLNVQTAAACVLFEYARQHRKSGK